MHTMQKEAFNHWGMGDKNVNLNQKNNNKRTQRSFYTLISHIGSVISSCSDEPAYLNINIIFKQTRKQHAVDFICRRGI